MSMCPYEALLELLEIQAIVDLAVLEYPLPQEGAQETPLHFLAFVESPSYDWNTLQALSDQFRAELKNRRRARGLAGDAPG